MGIKQDMAWRYDSEWYIMISYGDTLDLPVDIIHSFSTIYPEMHVLEPVSLAY